MAERAVATRFDGRDAAASTDPDSLWRGATTNNVGQIVTGVNGSPIVGSDQLEELLHADDLVGIAVETADDTDDLPVVCVVAEASQEVLDVAVVEDLSLIHI